MKNKEKVVVAMSGGVDSSMAAILLKKRGYDVVGVTLKLVDGSRCCDIEAVGHAREVCKKFGIPHYVFDVSKKFNKIVVGYFIDELVAARTPNPCVICNRFLKFDQLFKIARKFGAEYVATGHYARVHKGTSEKRVLLRQLRRSLLAVQDSTARSGVPRFLALHRFSEVPKLKSGYYELKKGRDKVKDQSYYLCFLKQDWLKKILFPVGKYNKSEIYKLADKEGLDFLVMKKQSQDLCFAMKRLKDWPGEIIDVGGKILGKHEGIHHYTIGQRKGLLVPGGPYFVVGFDCKKNRVIVSRDSNDPMLFQKVVKLKNVNFISGKPKRETNVMAKIRYQQPLAKAILRISGLDGRNVSLEFRTLQRAVTKGQIAVFYVGEKCLGGGIIK